MKYILTTKELSDLTDKRESENEIEDLKKALEWCRDKLEQKGCNDGYCDTCPISHIGFDMVGDDYIDKEEGKNGVPTNRISYLVCMKHRNYSK